MSLQEGDPTRGIVDINTFSLWLAGYKEKLINQVFSDKGDLKTVDFVSDKTETPDEVYSYYLDNYPWEEIPQSLQNVIALQYGAASLDERKRIFTRLDKSSLRFRLASPSVRFNFDAYSETFINPLGVILHLQDSDRVSKGNWIIMKRPVSQEELESNDYMRDEIMPLFNMNLLPSHDQYQRFFELNDRIEPGITILPASLTQLHDIARLLDATQSRMKVTKFLI